MRSLICLAGTVVMLTLATREAAAQATPRDVKVRDDRKSFEGSKDWIYNNLEEGIREAKRTGKPLMVVFRCIPCEACQEFDDDVARRDPIIRDLLDKYVCVRIVQANTIDLTRFQYDFDQSFAVILMNPDMTIYGRFATRSDREESEDIALEGLREAMRMGLAIHKDHATLKPMLAGKQVRQTTYKTPLDYPTLSGRFGKAIDYEGQTAKSCMHCHQVREAERHVYRDAGKVIPDEVLFPYPDPEVLGLKMDPTQASTVEKVAPGSIASRAGIEKGDVIESLEGQPLISTADLQWVLHNTPSAPAKLSARVRRGGSARDVALELPGDWRRGNISWRTTSWELRRMGFGGMKLDPLTPEERSALKLPENGLGLRIKHVGQYAPHDVAKRAGFLAGDVIVEFDGMSAPLTESDLLAHALQKKRKGDRIEVTVARNGDRKTLSYVIP